MVKGVTDGHIFTTVLDENLYLPTGLQKINTVCSGFEKQKMVRINDKFTEKKHLITITDMIKCKVTVRMTVNTKKKGILKYLKNKQTYICNCICDLQ